MIEAWRFLSQLFRSELKDGEHSIARGNWRAEKTRTGFSRNQAPHSTIAGKSAATVTIITDDPYAGE